MDLERILILAAQEAGRIIKKNAFGFGDLQWKGHDDPVTELDRQTEATLRRYIANYMPANFVGEEFGVDHSGAEHTFYIDPIDGTKDFIRRNFHSSISIGVEKDNTLVGGCVYDFMREIMYVGTNGDAYILYNNKRVEFDPKQKLSKIAVDVDQVPKSVFMALQEDDRFSTIKRGGSFALHVAELAAGNYEGMLKFSKKGAPWDVAAGLYLLQSQNFYVSDFFGNPFDYKNPRKGIIALKPEVADVVLETIGFTRG